MSLKQKIDDLRKYRLMAFIIFVFCMVSTFSFLATSNMQGSSAANTSGFNAGNIISDAVMGNYTAMSLTEIQNFLTSKNSCRNTNYNQYLSLKAQYPNLDWHFENGHFVCLSEERFGDGEVIGSGQTAAEVIYQAAQDYKINPQVLLVLLEKEQSLISDDYPNTRQYRSATGYGCPDTAACSEKYYGFKNQVRNAAALFRNVLDNGYSVYPERTKGVYIGYNPNSACGRSEVYIENRATAALYRYTPYQPNAAALAAGYGTGDGCSAYGNRNFYLFFTDWFGSTQVKVDGEPIIIPDGEYTFTSASSANNTIGVTSDSNVQGLQFESANRAQRWLVKRDADGYYTLNDTSGNRPLSINGSAANGTNVQVAEPTTACMKKWKPYQTSDGYIIFESACAAGLVLDLGGNANITLWTVHGGPNQKWALRSGQVLSDGIYVIAAKADSNQVLDINGGNSANGANITSWQQNQIKDNQSWRLSYNSADDYYSIVNPYTGKSLSARSANVYNGVNIELWQQDAVCSQRWKIISNGSGSYSIHSMCSLQQVLDLNGPASNGTNISLWQSHGGVNQQWLIRPVMPAITDGTYVVTSRTSDSASFDIISGVEQDGANVAIWQLHGGTNQQWQITYNSIEGTYKIYNQRTHRYLSVASQSAGNGTNIQIQTEGDVCASKWYIYPNLVGYYTINSACNPHSVVDLNSGPINGNNITTWQSHGGIHQQWRFVKI